MLQWQTTHAIAKTFSPISHFLFRSLPVPAKIFALNITIISRLTGHYKRKKQLTRCFGNAQCIQSGCLNTACSHCVPTGCSKAANQIETAHCVLQRPILGNISRLLKDTSEGACKYVQTVQISYN